MTTENKMTESEKIEKERVNRWRWQYRYCTRINLDPDVNKNWEEAGRAYEEYHKEQKTEG